MVLVADGKGGLREEADGRATAAVEFLRGTWVAAAAMDERRTMAAVSTGGQAVVVNPQIVEPSDYRYITLINSLQRIHTTFYAQLLVKTRHQIDLNVINGLPYSTNIFVLCIRV